MHTKAHPKVRQANFIIKFTSEDFDKFHFIMNILQGHFKILLSRGKLTYFKDILNLRVCFWSVSPDCVWHGPPSTHHARIIPLIINSELRINIWRILPRQSGPNTTINILIREHKSIFNASKFYITSWSKIVKIIKDFLNILLLPQDNLNQCILGRVCC